jgi:hypothetical protein
MILPLGFVTTLRPRALAGGAGDRRAVHRSRRGQSRWAKPPRGLPRDGAIFSCAVDQFLKATTNRRSQSCAKKAMKAARKMAAGASGKLRGLGAIFPPMVYILIVFRALGYPDDHPRVVKAHKDLRDFFIEKAMTIRIQPCVSPVWDTGLALHALAEAGLIAEIRRRPRDGWLLEKECRTLPIGRKLPGRSSRRGWFSNFPIRIIRMWTTRRWWHHGLKRAGGETAAGDRARRRMAAGDAEHDGGWAAFDRTQGSADPGKNPLRRSQRHAGSELPGHRRARVRMPGPLRQ